ncbi:hypothetical protein [Moraxella marmotae]|uniref:hypothetical protein n=1 Tax=Moraxella marmotae TaxID=3344520 RepID=UPI0035F2F810
MGLDTYLYGIPDDVDLDEFAHATTTPPNTIELYWRKWYYLFDWLSHNTADADIYYPHIKDGEQEHYDYDLNCAYIAVTLDDLEILLEQTKQLATNQLLGVSDTTEYGTSASDDISDIETIIKTIKDNPHHTFYFYNWY